MLTAIALIAAGVAILATSHSYGHDARRVQEWRADDMRRRGLPRVVTRAASLSARYAGPVAVGFGAVVGIAAIVAGVLVLAGR